MYVQGIQNVKLSELVCFYIFHGILLKLIDIRGQQIEYLKLLYWKFNFNAYVQCDK